MPHSLRVEYLPRLFGILLFGMFVFYPYLFVLLVWMHGYFILSVKIQYYLYLLLSCSRFNHWEHFQLATMSL